MNQDENNKLTYGSIVQLKDVNNTYQNQFFFISYIIQTHIYLHYLKSHIFSFANFLL